MAANEELGNQNENGKTEAEKQGKNGSTKGGHWIPANWVVELEEVEPWPEPVDGKALLDELAETVKRFVVLGPGVLGTICLWVVHTYAFELRDVTTYLGIESPEHRCGKSTLLSVLAKLVKRPVRTANISPPAFFRVIAETNPALLVDEADTFLHSEKLRGILNSGYQRDGAFVMRVSHELSNSETTAGQNGNKKEENGSNGLGRLVNFSCWCPKAIAQIGRLPRTLADRCIVLRMERKMADEPCERLKNLSGEALRRKCQRFVQDRAEAIGRAQPPLPEGMNDRASDIWEPLLAVADLAGGEWPERARKAALGLSASAQENDPMGSLLMDILELFMRLPAERIFSARLVGWLNGIEERPWVALKKGKAVTGQWLAQQLAGYGVRPKTMRIGEQRAKGYEFEDLKEAFRRYIPRREWEAFKEKLRAEEAEREKAPEAPGTEPGAAGKEPGGVDEGKESGAGQES